MSQSERESFHQYLTNCHEALIVQLSSPIGDIHYEFLVKEKSGKKNAISFTALSTESDP